MESEDEAFSGDEYERWRANEMRSSREDFKREGNTVTYWLSLSHKYPALAQLALDLMTIPVSSSKCERLFSQLGDLLQPKRRKIGAQLLAALQCVQSWVEAEFMSGNDEVDESTLTDSAVEVLYNLFK